MGEKIRCACPLCEGNCDKCVCRLAEGRGEHLSCFERAERIKNDPKLQERIKALCDSGLKKQFNSLQRLT